ncbi:uncharacterized protein LOC118433430 isoform X1 [Folsomia candida]|uniref:uncharacterized protein LOC118433430 isoform X1 n=2 Tax=Folsomia candida TaxID=158441 RepID=UPI00160511E5|nr:uncharacterized protein LOC118433430 isoform X1 [Folsomia candida]XP_035701249.1 uncharacterized protein LOC118433430 isoform X1 [Folsomia candida]
MNQAVQDVVADYFKKFKHCKIHYDEAWMGTEKNKMLPEISLKHLSQLVELIGHPAGSLRINFPFGKSNKKEKYASDEVVSKVTNAINNCPKVTMSLGTATIYEYDYEPNAYSGGIKFNTCPSIKIRSDQVQKTVLLFTNVQSIKFTKECFHYAFPTVMNRIVENLHQFDKLVEIRCDKSILLESVTGLNCIQDIGSLNKLSTSLKHLHLKIRCDYYAGSEDGYAELGEVLAKHAPTLETLGLSFKWRVDYFGEEQEDDENPDYGRISVPDVFPKLEMLQITVGNSHRSSPPRMTRSEMMDIFGLVDSTEEGRFYDKFPSLRNLSLILQTSSGCSVSGNVFDDESVIRFRNEGFVSILQEIGENRDEDTTDEED